MRAAVLGLAAVMAVAGCGSSGEPSAQSTAPVPTSVSGGRMVCGVVPARAVTLAVGTSRWKAETGQEPMSTSTALPQACYVDSAGSSHQRRLLIVEKAKQADPTGIKAQIDQQIAGGGKRLPSDVAGDGYLHEESAHDVQVRLIVGDVQVQIYLLKGGAKRDSRADALNLTRLLLPRLVTGS